MKNNLAQEKFKKPRSTTFNPELVLISFRTTQPGRELVNSTFFTDKVMEIQLLRTFSTNVSTGVLLSNLSTKLSAQQALL